MLRQLRIALILLALFTVLTGIIYPLVVTGIAQGLFHHKANGSLITENGTVVGSELIGQWFSDPRYFWGRLSATTPPYTASASSGSNYGPSNPLLQQEIQERIDDLRKAEKAVGLDNNQTIPVDLVTYSASGLDPDISIAAANYQVPRVARYRGLSEDQVYGLVEHCTESRQFGVLGEPRVNVLKLNLALDELE